MFAQLPRHQELLCDMHLLVFGVTGEPDDLHPIAEWRNNRVDDVAGGDEQHLRQVVGHFQVVVGEVLVLLGIEHLEQRGGRIAAPVSAHLVDLVEHEDRVARPRDFHLLEDSSRHGADVGSPVTADLGLVVDAAEREPHELAPQGPGDRLAKAGLADAGRTDEAQDGRPQALRALPDGHVLEDPFLDFFDAVVVFVQDLGRQLDVPGLGDRATPGEGNQPIDIGPDDAHLG